MKTRGVISIQRVPRRDGGERLRLVDACRTVAKLDFFMEYSWEWNDIPPIECFVSYLETHPRHRYRGHASELLRHLELLAVSQGKRAVFLLCDKRDGQLLRFYAKRGYRPAASQPFELVDADMFFLLTKPLTSLQVPLS